MILTIKKSKILFAIGLAALMLTLLISGCGNNEDVSAKPGGPPNIPHTTVAIDNCLACHETGLMGTAPVTPHPERPVCTACHMPKSDS